MPRYLLAWRPLARLVVWVLLGVLMVIAKAAWIVTSACLWTLADIENRLNDVDDSAR